MCAQFSAQFYNHIHSRTPQLVNQPCHKIVTCTGQNKYRQTSVLSVEVEPMITVSVQRNVIYALYSVSTVWMF
jgi:hypothetical protein